MIRNIDELVLLLVRRVVCGSFFLVLLASGATIANSKKINLLLLNHCAAMRYGVKEQENLIALLSIVIVLHR